MAKLKKIRQLVTIAITAYSLYRTVSDFLETPVGKKMKKKAKPYIKKAKKKVEPYVESATEKVSDMATELKDKAVEAISRDN